MRKEEIDILLKRYYEGLSTDEDEKTLKVFFNGNNIPEGYETEKAIFRYYSDFSNIPAPSEDFEDRIVSSLDTLSRHGKRSFNKIVLAVSGIAAGLLILIGSWFLFSGNRTEDTYSDPAVAYAETIKILYGVSTKMNSGTAGLEPVSRMNLKDFEALDVLSRSNETIEKNLMNLEYLDKILEITNFSDQEKK